MTPAQSRVRQHVYEISRRAWAEGARLHLAAVDAIRAVWFARIGEAQAEFADLGGEPIDGQDPRRPKFYTKLP